MRHSFFSLLARTVLVPLPAVACLGAILLATDAPATTITLNESGYSTLGTFLDVSATLSTQYGSDPNDQSGSGEKHYLKVVLRSFGAPTVGKADVLSSFYFNLADPNSPFNRPSDLTLISGSGRAYQVNKNAADTAVSWSPQTWSTSGTAATAPSNLVAKVNFDEGWQFKSQTPPQAAPSLGFGIGTVGNSDITDFVPTGFGFDGNVVRGNTPGDMINLGIYSDGTADVLNKTDINPDGGLSGSRLIKTEATFMFYTPLFDLRAVTGESWVQDNVTWGFGTGPETVFLPEPGTLPMLATGGLFALGWMARRRTRRGSSGSPPQAFPQATQP